MCCPMRNATVPSQRSTPRAAAAPSKWCPKFDVALETGTNQFSADMPVMGIDALELFLSKSKTPFFHSGLREVLTGNRCIESQGLGPVSPESQKKEK